MAVKFGVNETVFLAFHRVTETISCSSQFTFPCSARFASARLKT